MDHFLRHKAKAVARYRVFAERPHEVSPWCGNPVVKIDHLRGKLPREPSVHCQRRRESCEAHGEVLSQLACRTVDRVGRDYSVQECLDIRREHAVHVPNVAVQQLSLQYCRGHIDLAPAVELEISPMAPCKPGHHAGDGDNKSSRYPGSRGGLAPHRGVDHLWRVEWQLAARSRSSLLDPTI